MRASVERRHVMLPASFEPHTEVIAARSCLDRVFRRPHQSALADRSSQAEDDLLFVHATRECAFHEHILSTPPDQRTFRALETKHLIGLHYCELRACVDLTIATLYGPDRQRIERLTMPPAKL
jgi:hypothetical protein